LIPSGVFHGHAIMPNRLDEIDQRSHLREVNCAHVRNQEHPHGTPERAVAEICGRSCCQHCPNEFVGRAHGKEFRTTHRVLDRQMIA
jgi:hypothetical protein